MNAVKGSNESELVRWPYHERNSCWRNGVAWRKTVGRIRLVTHEKPHCKLVKNTNVYRSAAIGSSYVKLFGPGRKVQHLEDDCSRALRCGRDAGRLEYNKPSARLPFLVLWPKDRRSIPPNYMITVLIQLYALRRSQNYTWLFRAWQQGLMPSKQASAVASQVTKTAAARRQSNDHSRSKPPSSQFLVEVRSLPSSRGSPSWPGPQPWSDLGP